MHVPTGFQALRVHATGELLSETILAMDNEEEDGSKHIFITLQFALCHGFTCTFWHMQPIFMHNVSR